MSLKVTTVAPFFVNKCNFIVWIYCNLYHFCLFLFHLVSGNTEITLTTINLYPFPHVIECGLVCVYDDTDFYDATNALLDCYWALIGFVAPFFQICCFLGFLCIICSSVHLHNFRGCFYNICVIVAFVCTLLVLLARLFQLWQRKFYKFNAVKYEFYLHVFLAFTCFVAGCFTISLDVLSYTIATVCWEEDWFIHSLISLQCHILWQLFIWNYFLFYMFYIFFILFITVFCISRL